VRFPDGRTIATGSGGSKRIRSAIVQVLVNLIDYGMSVEEAVNLPRIFVEDGKLSAEGGFAERSIEPLAESWPEPEVWDELNLYFGGVHTTVHGPKGFDGAGDPRRCGLCIVVD
jgi:gamma-glutamyltranspeptidase/glutathione hydrolase